MSEYQLVFEENFDSKGKPNPQYWTFQIGDKWANNEKQCYTDDLKNCYIEDGALHIIGSKEEGKCAYHSARITTKNKVSFQYGKLQIRAKLPVGRGAWPAIWMMGVEEEPKLGWPACGEIDIMEFAGNRPNQVTCAIHTETYNHRIHTDKGATLMLDDLSSAFHDYILDWEKDHLSFYVDDQLMMHLDKQEKDTHAEWPFEKPYYLILNLAVGGWYAGDIVDSDLPFHFEIAYIHYYQKK